MTLLWFAVPLGLCGVIALLIYIYLTWDFDYWKKRGINGPKPRLLFGNLPNVILQKQNSALDMDEIYKKYKHKENFVGFFMTRKPDLMVIDPETCKDVMIRCFKNFHDNAAGKWFEDKADPLLGRNPFFVVGEEWKEQRSYLTPAFTLARVKSMYPAMLSASKKLNQYIETNHTCVDATSIAANFTVDIVSTCFYGIESNIFTDPHSKIKEKGEALIADFEWMMVYFFLKSAFPFLKFFKQPESSKAPRDFFIPLMKKAMELREESGNKGSDPLSYIMEIQKQRNLSDHEIAAVGVTFFIEGYVTSSITISHCLHMLARHRAIQARLRAEINQAIEKEGALTFEKLNELPLLDQCINESLRLFPPAPSLARLCSESCTLTNYKGKEVLIDKGTVVWIPVYSFHRDEEFYPNANEFDPDRFSPENGGIKRYKDLGVFLPFGDGPRGCLGMRFALAQVKAAIVAFVQNWEIILNPKTKKEVSMDAKKYLYTQDGGVWLDFRKIK